MPRVGRAASREEKRRVPSSEQQQSSNTTATRGPGRPTMRTPAMGQWYTRTGARDVPLGAAVRRFTSMRDQRGSGQRQRLGRGTIQSVMLRGGENETGWPLASRTRHSMCSTMAQTHHWHCIVVQRVPAQRCGFVASSRDGTAARVGADSRLPAAALRAAAALL